MEGSEVARIREDIALSYLSAQWGLTGLASGTCQHRFITARMERVQNSHTELQKYVGDQAIQMVAETLEELPKHPTRHYLQQILKRELGETEETNHLLDYLTDAWETMDLLVERFGREDATKLITAPSHLNENSLLS